MDDARSAATPKSQSNIRGGETVSSIFAAADHALSRSETEVSGSTLTLQIPMYHAVLVQKSESYQNFSHYQADVKFF